MVKNTLTQQVMEAILDQNLKPLTAKIDPFIESIEFWERVELHQKTGNVEYSKASINELQLYIRWECVEISGIPEETNEDTTLL